MSSSTIRSGLAQGRLGAGSLVFFTVSASAPMTVLAGSLVTTLAVTGSVGTPLSFPILAVALGLFAVGYAAMSRYVFNAGAFYTYISQGIGRAWGVSAAFVALVSYNAIQICLYGLFGAVFGAFLTQHFGVTWPWWAWSFIAWAVIGILGILKIDLNSRVLAVLLICEILAVLVFDYGALTHPDGGKITFAGLDARNLFTPGIGGVFAFGIASFVGFESAPTYSEEARDSARTVARATYAAVAITGVLYTLSAWALTVGAGPDKVVAAASDPKSGIPFSLIVADFGPAGVALADIANVLLITSVFAAMLSFHNVVARYMYSSAREGVLPVVFARTGARSNAPIAGSVTQSLLAIVVTGIFVQLNRDPVTELFTWLAYVSAVGVLLLMIGTSVAVVGFFRQRPAGPETVWQRVVAPVLATVALLAIVWVTVQNSSSVLGTNTSSPLVWILPGVIFAVAVLGLALGLLLRAMLPEVYAGIGRGGLEPRVPAAAWHHPPEYVQPAAHPAYGAGSSAYHAHGVGPAARHQYPGRPQS